MSKKNWALLVNANQYCGVRKVFACFATGGNPQVSTKCSDGNLPAKSTCPKSKTSRSLWLTRDLHEPITLTRQAAALNARRFRRLAVLHQQTRIISGRHSVFLRRRLLNSRNRFTSIEIPNCRDSTLFVRMPT